MTEIRACEGTDLRRALCCRHRIFKDLSVGFAQCERDATGAASVPPPARPIAPAFFALADWRFIYMSMTILSAKLAYRKMSRPTAHHFATA